MSTNTVANTVAAVGAVATLITALSLLIPTLRRVKATEASVGQTQQTVATVHTIVNQLSTDKDRRIVALTQQLIDAGHTPVRDQSLPVPGQPDAQPGQPT